MLIRPRQKSQSKRGKFSKKLKKDYQSKSLSNPFFRSKKAKKTQSIYNKKIILLIILLLIFFGTIYLLFFSNIFKTTEIQISGLERINTESVLQFIEMKQAEKTYLIFSQSNIIFLNNNKLASEIKSHFRLASATVKKKYSHGLQIDLEERPISFIWQDETERVYSDANGCLIREEPVIDSDSSVYLNLVSDAGDKYLNKDDCLDLKVEYFEALLKLNDELSKAPSLKPEKFILSSELNSLVADLDQGPNIIFNTKEDLNKQVNKLLIIRQEQVESDFLALEYIDLRYGDLIYFK